MAPSFRTKTIATAELPKEQKNDLALFTGCMAGASLITEIKFMLTEAGFEAVAIKPKDNSKEFIRKWAPDTKIEDYVLSLPDVQFDRNELPFWVFPARTRQNIFVLINVA